MAKGLGVIAEAILGDRQKANEKYEELKQSQAYDSQKNEWKSGLPQIIGVAVEGLLGDKNQATRRYKELKNSSAYNSQKGEFKFK